MNPHTGAVYVMASTPTYDPNLIEQPNGYARVLKIRGDCGGASALLQPRDAGSLRAGLDVQDRSPPPPRSTRATYNAELDVRRSRLLHGVRQAGLERGQPRPGRARGVRPRELRARRSSTPSTRSSATSASKLGAGTILDVREEVRLLQDAAARDARRTSARRAASTTGTQLFDPKDPHQVDPGRLAFGQERMLVTPLQMAMVAATIANGGVVPKPYVVQKIVAHDGSTVRNTKPGNLGRADQAGDRRDADADDGRRHRGRHRQRGRDSRHPRRRQDRHRGDRASTTSTRPGSSAFAPAENPQVAVAVVLEKQPNGFGGVRRGPDREAGHGGPAGPLRGRLPCRDPRGRLGHAHRHALRRALPGRPQARRGRDGERLPRRGPGARSPRRDQDPERPARERRPVRRALPPRGEERGRALASEHRLDLRPRRGRGHLLHRDGVPRRAHAQGARSSRAGRADHRRRSSTRARSCRRFASRTGTASCTATSSRTTCSSTPRAA